MQNHDRLFYYTVHTACFKTTDVSQNASIGLGTTLTNDIWSKLSFEPSHATTQRVSFDLITTDENADSFEIRL